MFNHRWYKAYPDSETFCIGASPLVAYGSVATNTGSGAGACLLRGEQATVPVGQFIEELFDVEQHCWIVSHCLHVYREERADCDLGW